MELIILLVAIYAMPFLIICFSIIVFITYHRFSKNTRDLNGRSSDLYLLQFDYVKVNHLNCHMTNSYRSNDLTEEQCLISND